MSVSERASGRPLSRGSNRSRSGTGASQASVGPADMPRYFEPCAATAAMFLFAQGSSILCLHHDTLALERRFQRHTEPIVFIAVDNVSERGAGRQVVSYDEGQTAIVWDLFTGDEIARFASYDHICVAAWMRNGNVAFGNVNGQVMLFEPSTSEHISARTICDPITAIAPAADCRTYAVGYLNGSILICALQPSFTILHTLTTPRAPSPVVTLAWHTSSSKQKSAMLATQTEDGDLRVWSIVKHPSPDPPRIVRLLKRSDNVEPGPNWLAWSKNGRIVQYSEGSTSAWDVRTKQITYEPVPTLDVVNGLAIYGPTATLFTLGLNHTVQQFDLDPPTLVANKQHLPPLAPPSPPVSVEEQRSKLGVTPTIVTVPPPANKNLAPARDAADVEAAAVSPLERIAEEMEQIDERRYERRHERSGALSPSSSSARSVGASSSRSATSRRHNRSDVSVSSGVPPSEGTYMSYGASTNASFASVSKSTTPSVTSSRKSRTRSSRLRNEVILSPEQVAPTFDLFPLARVRLSDVPYRNPQAHDPSSLTAADLRRQMLSVVFGWHDDIEALIQAELRGHSPGSQGAVLLSKWLNDVTADMVTSMTSSDAMTSSDWMLLALSSIGGQSSTKKIGQAFVQRLLEKGDIHAAATILLGLGEQNDAVEVYFSHKHFMEAVLLTCLVFPNDWQRQSQLVRKWGEDAVQHNQQQLAIRCFSCTGVETASVLTSPRAWDNSSFTQHDGLARVLSPPLSPPGERPGRLTAKNASLKLITSFGKKGLAGPNGHKSGLFGLGDGDRTPMNGAGITPIADSAISPGGMNNFLRPSARAQKAPDSARTATPGGFTRRRLPSIGETPIDVTPKAGLDRGLLPTPADSGSDREKTEESKGEASSSEQDANEPQLLLSSAKYNPSAGGRSPAPQAQQPASTAPIRGPFSAFEKQARARNGSRDRKPDGLQIHWPPMEAIIAGDYVAPGGDKDQQPGRNRADSSVDSPSTLYSQSVASPPLTGNSLRSVRTAQTGKSIDRYISSLEEANYHAKRQRDESRRRYESRDRRRNQAAEEERDGRGRSSDRRRPKVAELNDDRGRSGMRYIQPAKRSPSSPVPMSPEDYLNNSTDNYDDERYYGVSSPAVETKRRKDGSRVRTGASRQRRDSNGPLTARRASPERGYGSRAVSRSRAKASSRATSRRQSPDGRETLSGRGRSKSRTENAAARSPSSPMPMSLQSNGRAQVDADDEEEELRAVQADRKRFRSRQRSTSRRPSDMGPSSLRNDSPDRGHIRERSRSRPGPVHKRSVSHTLERRESSPESLIRRAASRGVGTEKKEGLQRRKSERMRKKELAAQELEERRQSLARRPSAPTIPHPEDILASRSPINARAFEFPRSATAKVSPFAWSEHGSAKGRNTAADDSAVTLGLPATPRAMRHPKYFGSENKEEIPAVPDLPTDLFSLSRKNSSDQSYGHQGGEVLSSEMIAELQRRCESAPAFQPALPGSLPTHPAFLRDLRPSTRRRDVRQQDVGVVNGHHAAPQTVMISIDETIHSGHEDNHANDIVVVPPQPSSGPLLPELQHLAQPPPPPPGPPAPPSMVRPGHSHNNSIDTAASGIINIAMDGSRSGTPVVDVPSRTQSTQSQARGRGPNDSLTSTLRRATHRMRSGSRNRNKSPPGPDSYRTVSPYESIPPPPMLPEVPMRSHTTSPYLERHPKEVRAHVMSEMNNNGYMEGGMI